MFASSVSNAEMLSATGYMLLESWHSCEWLCNSIDQRFLENEVLPEYVNAITLSSISARVSHITRGLCKWNMQRVVSLGDVDVAHWFL